MKFKTTLTLLGIFVIIGVVIIVMEQGERGEKKDRPYLFSDVAIDKIAAIRAISKSGTITLKKKQEGWVVAGANDFPADKEAVSKLLATIQEMKKETISSRNPQKQAIFQVDKDSGTEIKILDSQDEVIAGFFLGKSGPDFYSTYVRRNDSEEVILVSDYLKTIFVKSEDDWRDKNLFHLNPEEIVRIAILSTGKKIVVEKNEGDDWKVLEPEEVKAKNEVVEKMRYEFSQLKATGFADGEKLEDCGLVDPQSRIIVTLKDGSKKSLLIGKKKDEHKIYARVEDKETIFLIPGYRVDALSKSLQDFKEEKKPKEENNKS